MKKTAKVKEGSTVAVFGLGVIGLAVIEVRWMSVSQPCYSALQLPVRLLQACPPQICPTYSTHGPAFARSLSSADGWHCASRATNAVHTRALSLAGGEAGWRIAHLWHRHQSIEVRARKEVGR